MIEKELDQWIKYIVDTYKPESPIIDFGCGANKKFSYPGIVYHGVDLDIRSEIVCDVHDVKGINDETYNTAVSFDALEHFENPIKVISEMVRVVKNGGLIVISTVFIWTIHKHPTDYFRFTDDCIRLMLKRNGCEIIECDLSNPSGGGFETSENRGCLGVHVYAIARKIGKK